MVLLAQNKPLARYKTFCTDVLRQDTSHAESCSRTMNGQGYIIEEGVWQLRTCEDRFLGPPCASSSSRISRKLGSSARPGVPPPAGAAWAAFAA